MSSPIRLIVGLGNPGKEYEATRHNAGFWFVDEVARTFGGIFKSESKYNGDTSKVLINGHDVFLLKPNTFMNRSGQAVAKLANFYKIPVDSILVAHDELDFEPGTTRLKVGGGHGGHNGLRDIISQMGNNKEFLRLRIGIGHPGSREQVTGFVLSKAKSDDQQQIEHTFNDVIRILPELVDGNIQVAMNNLHSNRD